MTNYSSDYDVVSPTMKRRCIQVLSSSSEDVIDEDTQSDTQTDTSISEDTDSEGDVSENENQDTNVTWGITADNREPFRFSANPSQQQTVPRRFRNKCLFYVEKYLDDVVISVTVAQTNLYADQFLQGHPNLKPRSKIRKWHPTNNSKIRCFIAILILQGIVKKPTLQSYFSKRESVNTPFFSKVMSADRFSLLCKFLHFENNQLCDQTEPRTNETKIKTVMENIVKKCHKLYIFRKWIFASMNHC